MDEFDENILNNAERSMKDAISAYEEAMELYFNKHANGSSSAFYSLLNNKTNQVKDKCYNILVGCFRKLCLAAGIPLVKKIFSSFSSSIRFYLNQAFGQYKSVYTNLFSKYREQLSEQKLRDKLFKDVLKAQGNVRKMMLKKEDIVISVGKRSFHLSNYLRIVAEQEVRTKFVYSTLQKAKNSGAIGIRISDHNTKTKLCDLYEGKTYLFKDNGLSKLKHGLPPFHVNCKHFVIPVYEDDRF